MSQHQHTPGNWYAKHGINQMIDDGTCIVCVRRNLLKAGWFVFSDAETHGDEEADAKLIAATPRLLAALERMVEVFGPGVDCFGDGAGEGEIIAVKEARAAIVSAGGLAA